MADYILTQERSRGVYTITTSIKYYNNIWGITTSKSRHNNKMSLLPQYRVNISMR